MTVLWVFLTIWFVYLLGRICWEQNCQILKKVASCDNFSILFWMGICLGWWWKAGKFSLLSHRCGSEILPIYFLAPVHRSAFSSSTHKVEAGILSSPCLAISRVDVSFFLGGGRGGRGQGLFTFDFDAIIDQFYNGWKNYTWLIYCDFSQFTSIIWLCGYDKFNNAVVYCRVRSCSRLQSCT